MARSNVDGFVKSYLSRNFHLVLLVLLVSTVALFTGRLTGGAWATLAAALVTTFRAGDAVVNWIHRDSPNWTDADHTEPLGVTPAAPSQVSLDDWVKTGVSNVADR